MRVLHKYLYIGISYYYEVRTVHGLISFICRQQRDFS